MILIYFLYNSSTANNLLGTFEESVLNGRLEPVSTVEGFSAEIGASGSFHPKHKTVPVNVFFYNMCCDNSPSISSPYLGNYLGKLTKLGNFISKLRVDILNKLYYLLRILK